MVKFHPLKVEKSQINGLAADKQSGRQGGSGHTFIETILSFMDGVYETV